MKVPDGQTIEECIRDDVHDLLVKTGRNLRLAYLVNWGDATNILQRLKPDIIDAKFHARDFELHTEGELVRVVGDLNSPRGAVYRCVVCECGELALYHPGSDGLCMYCLTRRPYAPGEKMTDRHPDSVIAQVVEETIEEHGIDSWGTYRSVDRSATPQKLSGSVICTTPGYNGVFHIEPDPPDLASGPEDPLAGLSSRDIERYRRSQPLTVWETDSQQNQQRAIEHNARVAAAQARPSARPDGFDQHQVDAAKAALLAPAPPRYPRRTR